MAVPNLRESSHHRVKEATRSSNKAETEIRDEEVPTNINTYPHSSESEDDADVSESDEDSEDDSDSDDSEDSQEEDVNSTTVQHETPVKAAPAPRTSANEDVQSANQERKSSKRPAEEEIHPEYQQSTLKKKRALQDISGSNSRTNALAGAFESPEAKAASEKGRTIQPLTTAAVKAMQQKPRAVSASSALRASKSGNNWPHLQNSTEFAAATLAEQRLELNCYRKDLFNYVDMIQAGAIPVSFVKSLLGRLDTHIEQMDTKMQAVEKLHSKENKRLTKMAKLYNDASEDYRKATQLIMDLVSPATHAP